MANYFRITLLRSAIGLPQKTHGVLRALGLRKRLRTVYHPVSPQVAGMVFAVKELEVDQQLTKDEMKDLRRPDPGFYIERRAGEGREAEV
ncbi:39S ribosomal protein L33, mitochondrial [Vermiconidia calcicola]|uniref:39S ribosomal protein L33, mitochondrial n=1 Tax=Vermiconidia calcicola TaxID=1690605 RepID=A0ACC3MPU6_9PEZI|nr:39S ribosomal protein L33, mitochondrial [Vermiconidia calcicola]